MTDAFFQERALPSELKHRILQRYLSAFVGKTGRLSPTGRVIYVDGFAGPGSYDDTSEGSPLIAAKVADLMRRRRELAGYFVEEDPSHAEQLRRNLIDAKPDWEVLEATAGAALPRILRRAGSDPMLIFLDPYGLAIPFDMLVQQVMSRPSTTEVLLHFSRSALRRLAGHLEPEWWQEAQRDRSTAVRQRGEAELRRLEQSRESILLRLDEFLGGKWWREIRQRRGRDWEHVVRHQYMERVLGAAGSGWRSFVAPISGQSEGKAIYWLALFTRHAHGLFQFNDATACAFQWLHEWEWTQSPDGPTLFADNPPDPRPEYIAQIKSNAVAALQERPQGFLVAQGVFELLGDDLIGKAGASEIREALQELHSQGVIAGPKPLSRKLESYRVSRGPRFRGS